MDQSLLRGPIAERQKAHLEDIGKCEDFGKGSSLTPARDCINDIRTKGGGIVFNIHCHLAINCHLQTLLAITACACSHMYMYVRSTAESACLKMITGRVQ